jgi:hypothetical protein
MAAAALRYYKARKEIFSFSLAEYAIIIVQVVGGRLTTPF